MRPQRQPARRNSNPNRILNATPFQLTPFGNAGPSTASRAQKLLGTHQLKHDEIFPPLFMARFTRFATYSQMVQSGPDKRESADPTWNEFVERNTAFVSWDEMLREGLRLWTLKQIDPDKHDRHYRKSRRTVTTPTTLGAPGDYLESSPSNVLSPHSHFRSNPLLRVDRTYVLMRDGSVRVMHRPDPETERAIQRGRNEMSVSQSTDPLFVAVTNQPPNKQQDDPTLQGVVMMGSAVPEVLTGAALVVATANPLGIVLGLVVIAHGLDGFSTGFWIVATKEQRQTFTARVAAEGLQQMGMSKSRAQAGGELFDSAIGLAAPTGGIKYASNAFDAQRIAILESNRRSQTLQSWAGILTGFTDPFEASTRARFLKGWQRNTVRRSRGKPTIASGQFGNYAISGWKLNTVYVPPNMIQRQGDVYQTSVKEVSQRLRENLKAHYPYQRVPSQVHAEPKLIANAPSTHLIRVGRNPCVKCWKTLYLQANHLDRPVFVEAPTGVFVFRPRITDSQALKRPLHPSQIQRILQQSDVWPEIHKGLRFTDKMAMGTAPIPKLSFVAMAGDDVQKVIQSRTEMWNTVYNSQPNDHQL